MAKARADDVFMTPMQNGATAVMTDDVGTCSVGHDAYLLNNAGVTTTHGCWVYTNPWIVVRWNDDGIVRKYRDFGAWTEYAKKTYHIQ
jgi:hypothetical protein